MDAKDDKLTKIYKEYYGTMLSTAKAILSDHSLAEDAVSESFMTIINNLHKVGDILSHKTKAYIVIIVRSRAMDLLNKRKRHPEDPIDDFEIPDNSMSILDELTMKESCDRIISLIKELPKSLADVLYLSVVMGHSNEEMAELLNISNRAVRKRLSRAKAQLKGKLREEVMKREGK